jgi:hypothetical protein
MLAALGIGGDTMIVRVRALAEGAFPMAASSYILVVSRSGREPVELMRMLSAGGHTVRWCDLDGFTRTVRDREPSAVVMEADTDLALVCFLLGLLRIHEVTRLSIILVFSRDALSSEDIPLVALANLQQLLWKFESHLLVKSGDEAAVLAYLQERASVVTRLAETAAISTTADQAVSPVAASARPVARAASRRSGRGKVRKPATPRGSQKRAVTRRRTTARPARRRRTLTMWMMRTSLSVLVIVLVTLSAFGALISAESMLIFEKLQPTLLVVAGYFFGRQS